jgi:hypothetical protein
MTPLAASMKKRKSIFPRNDKRLQENLCKKSQALIFFSIISAKENFTIGRNRLSQPPGIVVTRVTDTIEG